MFLAMLTASDLLLCGFPLLQDDPNFDQVNQTKQTTDAWFPMFLCILRIS